MPSWVNGAQKEVWQKIISRNALLFFFLRKGYASLQLLHFY